MKLLLTRFAAASGTLLLAGVAVAALADPVVNGTFTTPASSPVSWGTLNNNTVGGPGTVDWGPGQYGYAPTNISGWTFSSFDAGSSGAGIADAGSAFGFTATSSGAGQVGFLQDTATLSQTIGGLTAGDEYTLLFNLEGRPTTGGAPITVSLGSDTWSPVVSTGAWTSYEFEYIPTTSGPETLTFSTSDPQDTDLTTGIDDVQIVTPEPASLLLMATGFLGLAFMMKRLTFSTPNDPVRP